MSTALTAITVADVDASISRVIQHAESIWDEWAWQVENQTWLVGDRWASWDEMRRAVYGNLNQISAPRAERPELVARFRGAGLTQRETAETLGTHVNTVKRYDGPTYKPREVKVPNGTSAPEPPANVNTETGEIVDAEIVEDEPEPTDTPESDYRDPNSITGWERTYKSFQELAKHLKKNPSPEQRERLARGLLELHKEITK